MRTICSLLLLMVVGSWVAIAQEEGRCGTVDTSHIPPLQRIHRVVNTTQNLAVVLVDFLDGRIQPDNRIPTTDADTIYFPGDSIDAVGGMGWIPDTASGGTLRKKIRKYTYEDYWDFVFSESTYVGARHPDFQSHGFEGFGSLREYYKEVSYGNLTLHPFQTWGRDSVLPTKYNTGIINAIDTANGKKYVRWIMMPGPKPSYPENGPLYAVEPVLDDLYSRGLIEFNRSAFVEAGGKIMIVAAGSSVGGMETGGYLYCVREKSWRNYDNRSTFDGIWISVHEFGHTLNFDHMCHGAYDPMNFTFRNWYPQLHCPQHFNPLFKWAAGWIPDARVAKVRTNGQISLAPVHRIPTDTSCIVALVTVYGDAGRDSNWSHSEYFMMENRTRDGFNRFAGGATPGGGFNGGGLIWHYRVIPYPIGYSDFTFNIGLKVQGFLPDPYFNFATNTGDPSHFYYSAGRALDSSTTPNSNSSADLVTGLSLHDFSLSSGTRVLSASVSYQLGTPPAYDVVSYEHGPSRPSWYGRVYSQNSSLVAEIAPGTIIDCAGSIDANEVQTSGQQSAIHFNGVGYGHHIMRWNGISCRTISQDVIPRLHNCIISNADVGVKIWPKFSHTNSFPTPIVRGCTFENCMLDIDAFGPTPVSVAEVAGLDSNTFTNLRLSYHTKLTNSDFTLAPGRHLILGTSGVGATLKSSRNFNLYGDLRVMSPSVLSGGTWRLMNDLLLADSPTLTINPNTRFEVGGYGIYVTGNLAVQGSQAQPVVFTSAGQGDPWLGIHIDNNCHNDVGLLYADISNCRTAVSVSSHSVFNMNLCTISNADIGLQIGGGEPSTLCSPSPPFKRILNSTFSQMGSHGIIINKFSNLLLEGNTIDGAGTPEEGYGIACFGSSPQLLRNTVKNACVGMLFGHGSSPLLEDVLNGGYNVVSNVNTAIWCYDQSNADLGSIGGGGRDEGGQNSFTDFKEWALTIDASTVSAQNNWWGTGADPSQYFNLAQEAKVTYEPWLTEPPHGAKGFSSGGDKEGGGLDQTVLPPVLQQVLSKRLKREYPQAAVLAKTIIANGTMPDYAKRWAASQLLAMSTQLYRPNLADYVATLARQPGSLARTYKHLLPDFYASEGLTNNATAMYDSNIVNYPRTEVERAALYGKFVHALYTNSDSVEGSSLLARLQRSYPGSVEVSLARTQLRNFRATRGLNGLNKANNPKSQAALASTLEKIALPSEFALQQNYPNPFNPTTQMGYSLPRDSHVSLTINDVLGRKVAELVNGTIEAGYHSVTWSPVNTSSGVYFARFTATDAVGTAMLTKVNKLVLTK